METVMNNKKRENKKKDVYEILVSEPHGIRSFGKFNGNARKIFK
jgi:hypothetical protein